MIKGQHHSIEALHKMSTAKKGKHLSKEHRQNVSAALKGLHRSDETCRKMSVALKGRYISEEHRRKISVALKGHSLSEKCRQSMSAAKKGKHLSEKHRKNISMATKGRCVSDETRKKISKAHKGQHLSKESRRKISEASKGHYVSDETRRKMSIALKGIPRPKEIRQKLSVAGKRWWGALPKWKRQQITALRIKSMLLALENMGHSPSSLERTMHQHFNVAGIVFETQKEFPPYFVDIWIPELNLAIECDGVYWHNLPGAREKERKRDRYLITRYKIRIVRVPEKIIHDDPEQVVHEIVSALQNNQEE